MIMMNRLREQALLPEALNDQTLHTEHKIR